MNNTDVLPIQWAFSMLTDRFYGWTAASYVANFVAYGVVALPELAAWILYLLGENEWFGWYVGTVGLYGSIFLCVLSPIFATLQLALPASAGGLGGDA